MEDNSGERFSPWTSYSDMFCSLLMIFILLFVFVMLQYVSVKLEDETKSQALIMAQADELNAEINSLRAQLSHFDGADERIADLESQIAALLLAKEELEQNNASLSYTKEELDAANAALLERIAALESSGATLQTDLDSANADYADLLALRDLLQLQLDDLRDKLEDYKLSDTLQKDRISTLEKENEALKEENEALQEDNEYLQKDKEAIEDDNADLEYDYEQLLKEKEALVQELEDLFKQNETLNAKLLQMGVDLDEANRKLVLLTDDTDGTGDDIVQLKTRLAEAEAALKAAQDQVVILGGDLEAAKSSTAALTEQLERSNADLEAARKQIIILNDDLDAAEKKAEEAEKKDDKDEQDANALEEAQQTIILLRSQIEEQDQLILDLRTQTENDAAALEATQARLKTAQEALKNLDENDLASAVALLQARVDQLEKELAEKDAALVEVAGIRLEVISAIRSALNKEGIDASVDSETGAIVLSSELLFDVNRSDLKRAGCDFLDSFFPTYYKVLTGSEFADSIAQIVVEGHTDTTGSYESNLKLSMQRAETVSNYCVNMFTGADREKLIGMISAQGCSFSNPIYDKDGKVDMDASRRVEIKFLLKDQYMIDEIKRIVEE